MIEGCARPKINVPTRTSNNQIENSSIEMTGRNNANNINKLNQLKGNWQGQDEAESCWKATLANLTKVQWIGSLHNLEEQEIDSAKEGPIDLVSFDEKTKMFFTHYNTVKNDKILTFASINKYLNYKYPRPLIHSFNYKEPNETNDEYDGSGHFVNIVGCDTVNTQGIHSQWIEFFDPKPDKVGTQYIKNYESYRIVNNQNFPTDLDATFFNFVRIRKKRNFPRPIPNDRIKTIKPSEFDCKLCFNEESIKDSLKVILKNRIFKPFVGNEIIFKGNFKIPIYDIVSYKYKSESNIDDFSQQIETVEVKTDSYLIINYNNNNKLEGGTTIRKIKKNKYLIDRVENLSKYTEIQKVIEENPNLNLIITKGGNRFLKFKPKSPINQTDSVYLDMDNLFKNKKPNRIYSKKEFENEVSLQYFKVTDAAVKVIQAFNTLMTKIDTSCCYTSPNTPCTSTDIKNKKTEKNHINYFEIDAKYLFPMDKKDGKTTMFASAFKDPTFGDYMFHIASTSVFDTNACVKCKCFPTQIRFPYTRPDGNFNVIFIPVDDYKKTDAVTKNDFNKLSEKTLKPNTIKQIGKPYLEMYGGYISNQKSSTFKEKMSSDGIIVEVLLTDNSLVKCYAICSEKDRFQWKE